MCPQNDCVYPLRYEPRIEELNDSKRQLEVEKINSELLVKLGDLDADLIISTGQYCACPQHRAPFITSETQDFVLSLNSRNDSDLVLILPALPLLSLHPQAWSLDPRRTAYLLAWQRRT